MRKGIEVEMKMQKKLNMVLVILLVILVSLVSFGGIYFKNKQDIVNVLPQYVLGTELEGYRKVILKVKEDTNTESDEVNSEDTTVENQDVDKEENEQSDETTKYTAEDYLKAAEVYRDRFKSLKIDNYSVTCDEDIGEIVITLPENNQTDIILSDITQIGEFTIKDSKTGEVLLNNHDVRSVDISTRESAVGEVTYMSINFNTQGAKKFMSVTQEYQNVINNNETTNENKTEEDDEKDNDEKIENNTNEDNAEKESEETENNTNEDNAEKESEENNNSKQVDIMIDSSKILTTDFSEIIDNGVLSLSLGSSTSKDETSKDELYSAYNLAAIIENDALPVDYQVERNAYVSALVEKHKLKSIICFEIAVALILALGLIAKYRRDGIIVSILSIGFIAILLIVLRYANVMISLEGMLAIEICYILNCAYGVLFCEYKKEKDLTSSEKKNVFKSLVKKYTVIAIPQLIIAILCCLTQWAQLTSFGMVIFWGVLINLVYNILVNKFLD